MPIDSTKSRAILVADLEALRAVEATPLLGQVIEAAKRGAYGDFTSNDACPRLNLDFHMRDVARELKTAPGVSMAKMIVEANMSGKYDD